MSKQGKGLAGFGAVASGSNSMKESTDEETKVMINQESKSNSEPNSSNKVGGNYEPALSNSVGEILHSVTKKPKPPIKRQISAYIDEEVAKKLDKFGKEHGKGAKSELINNFLKSVLN
ncbi:hypothetical protein AWH48_16770 [Domibacillus aminovorans]|uniref:Uncharacterized protein n=1 Tax=Domibacillus aminovorans TaxID=29332 RepID=A0A177KZ65_9BACI|nr:hypothetical protein [Domibacillus aminovorans]OAH58650.1 hypothetical protein AWH48_16770 [Domibacillus aminovorans]